MAEPTEEPQQARGAPGSRGIELMEQSERERRPSSAHATTGVNPLEPIDAAMVYLKTGDQGG